MTTGFILTIISAVFLLLFVLQFKALYKLCLKEREDSSAIRIVNNEKKE